ncbi:MAG: tail fiber domain-containing protein [Bacteroidota bacterium]
MKTLDISLFILLALFFFAPSYAQTGNYFAGSGAGISIGHSFANYNTFVGDSAGRSMFSGAFGTFVGKNAGFSLNNDTDNTILGSWANRFGTTGIDNVIIGARAGYRNNASDVVIIGNMAGYHHTTGTDVTFIGEDAGYMNTTGSDNVFVGEDAGYNNTTGGDNTFLGNTAGRQNTTGYRNTAIGNEALFDLGGPNNTDAHHNTAVGDSAGIDNGSGIFNTFIGAAAGAATEAANENTFIGAYAGYDNDRITSSGGTATSGRNTYMGFNCARFTRGGYDNVGMGARAYQTGFASGLFRVRNRTTFIGAAARVYADDAIVFGYEADTRKQYGIAIGTEANSDGVNSIAIGYQATVTSDNSIMLGNAAITSIRGHVNFTATSDGRMKSDVQENVPGLDFINTLRPVTYQMDMENEYALRDDTIPGGLAEALEAKKDIRYSGFIAQEVEQAAQTLGYEFSGVEAPEDSSQLYGLRYAEFVVPLVKAVQELNQKVDQQQQIMLSQAEQIEKYEQVLAQQQLPSQEEKIMAYEQQLAEYQKMLSSLTARMNAMEESQAQSYLSSNE